MRSFPLDADVLKPGSNLGSIVQFADHFTGQTFASTTADIANYRLSGTSATFLPLDDAPGGWSRITTNSTNPGQIETNGEAFKLEQGKPLVFDARIANGDVDAVVGFIGLALAGGADLGTTLPTDCAGFTLSADGTIKYVARKDSVGAATVTGYSFTADGQQRRLSMFWDGQATLSFFVDGLAVASVSANICDDEALTMHFGIKGSADTADIDYWVCKQARN